MNAIREVEDYVHRKGIFMTPEDRKAYIHDKYIRRAFTGETNTTSPITSPRGLATLFSPELELFEAVQTNAVNTTATLLFKYGVDVNISHTVDGQTPLHVAASSGHLLQVHFLLLNGANALVKDHAGHIASEVAMLHGHALLAEHLGHFQRISEKGAKRTASLNVLPSFDDPQAQVISRIREGFMNESL